MLCAYKHGFEMAHISITTTGCTRESINKAMDSINFHKVTTFESKKKKRLKLKCFGSSQT